jgi:hypothetical protein
MKPYRWSVFGVRRSAFGVRRFQGSPAFLELPGLLLPLDDPAPPDDAALSAFDAAGDSAAGLAASGAPDDFLA